ncbi:unnamed protein product [Caenorhabditis angaria]|uniref:Uncharacterized protein n=1 Tax=Caenorhabditis angaria TaxID=860376 RepID=A0A9P1ITG2_9PELO|nr:unnamed protein product [Caenorhabditis angaria]
MVQLELIENSEIILYICSLLRYECYESFIFFIPVFTVERILSTYFVNDYEKNHRAGILCIIITTVFFTTQLFVYIFAFRRPSMIITIIYVVLSFAGSILIFNILYVSNLQKLRKLRENPSCQYTLSKKYQLEENMRIMTVSFLDPAIAILLLIFPLLTCFVLYRHKNQGFLRKIKCLTKKWKIQETKRIVPTTHNETNIYFEQLQSSWK